VASHAVADARVRADRQVALIAERGPPADGNRAPTRRYGRLPGRLPWLPASGPNWLYGGRAW